MQYEIADTSRKVSPNPKNVLPHEKFGIGITSENRKISLKAITRIITTQEEGFLNFLRPLMVAGLPLMKSVLTTLNIFCHRLDYQQQCQQQMQLFKRKCMDQIQQ